MTCFDALLIKKIGQIGIQKVAFAFWQKNADLKYDHVI